MKINTRIRLVPQRTQTNRRRLPTFVGALCLLPLWSPFAQGDRGKDQVAQTRTALENYVETRRLIAKEKRDWAIGRELLTDRIELQKDTIETLKGKIRDAEKSISDAGQVQMELEREHQDFEDASSALQAVVGKMESRLLQILDRLPDPLREMVRPLSQRLPRSASTEAEKKNGEGKSVTAGAKGVRSLSLGQRFMSIVGILNEVDKFAREIHVGSEVMKLSEGRHVEVTTLYIGISYGFYVNQKGDVAGVGTSNSSSWNWVQTNEAASAIKDAIAIYRNEKEVRYVRLPVRIH